MVMTSPVLCGRAWLLRDLASVVYPSGPDLQRRKERSFPTGTSVSVRRHRSVAGWPTLSLILFRCRDGSRRAVPERQDPDVTRCGRALFETAAQRLEVPLMVGRGAAGFVMLVVPDIVAGWWLGSRSGAGRRFVRALGVRDVVICTAQLRASRRERSRWRRVAGIADLFDGIVTVHRAVVLRRPVAVVIAVSAFGAALLSRVVIPDEENRVLDKRAREVRARDEKQRYDNDLGVSRRAPHE